MVNIELRQPPKVQQQEGMQREKELEREDIASIPQLLHLAVSLIES